MIIKAQMGSHCLADQVKSHYSSIVTNFSVIVSGFVRVFEEHRQIGYVQSSSTLDMAADNLKRRVFKKIKLSYVDLIMFENCLSKMTLMHDVFSAFKRGCFEDDR